MKKKALIEIEFDDENGYKGHGDNTSEVIIGAIEGMVLSPLCDDNVIKPGYKIELIASSEDKVLIMPPSTRKIILDRLDKLMDDCDNQAEAFRKANMSHAEISSTGMGQAYWVFKQFIDVNS